MNNSKLPSLKFSNYCGSNNRKTGYTKRVKERPSNSPVEFELLEAYDQYVGSAELPRLKDSAKHLNMNLPLSMDPKRHYGYEIIPDDRARDFDEMTCCDLESFLPYQPPYIPLILRCLVNYLEDCSHNIEYMYWKAPQFGSRAKRILINLANSQQEYFTMLETIRHEDVQHVALAVLLFLRSLCPVLLLSSGSSRIHDKKGKRNYKACLHCSCFLMIHLMHIWEYSKDPVTCLCLLSEVFGPILLKPKDNGVNEEESVNNFTVLMMNHDYDFWYGLSRYPMRMIHMFNGVTGEESKYLNARYKQLHCK